MDVTFNNVLEGTRQYFMGLPKQAQPESSGQPVWPASGPPPEEGAPALSGAPAPSSRPPSAAAAPPSTPISAPPRPPSEPIEPEPHIIHKATVMREAAEKRREQFDPDDEEEPEDALSPPSHIIRKPTPRTLSSPAPAPAAPCPSPARPPSAAPLHPPSVPESQPEHSAHYRPVHRVQTPIARPPDHFASSRPPDPYSVSRPPEQYVRYHYEPSLTDGGRSSQGPPVVSPQPSAHPRHSPQTYARLSSSMPQHASRLRDAAAQSTPAQRYMLPTSQPPPPVNDRVPPIHHPSVAPPLQRHVPGDSRTAHMYPPMHQRHESPYNRPSSHYDRHPSVPSRKYDPQQAYPGYRPTPTTPPVQNRLETHHQVQYKHGTMDVMNAHYPPRHPDRTPIPPQSSDTARITARPDYSVARSVDVRSSYQYPTQSPSTARYGPSTPVPVVQNHTVQPRLAQRTATVPKPSYDPATSNHIQTSPARSTVKPGYPNQQARMTVSVTTLVNQMNQTKQKRESPLDLSVKTVKNSADSSTTQDDLVDSASAENKSFPLQVRPSSSSRHLPQGYAGSHKVDFAPDFSQYRERSVTHSYNGVTQPIRYNGTYDTRRPIVEPYPGESRHQVYDRSKYPVPVRTDYVPRIDLTRSAAEERHNESRIRDDRHVAEERKRPAGPIVSNIPDKIVRYETWSSDSRIERMSQSAKEQKDLMSRPVYSYSSHKQFEAYQNEQKRTGPTSMYREHYSQVNHRYPTHSYPVEPTTREVSEYHAHYHDRSSSSSRHVIQKIPNIRDMHRLQVEPPPSGIPADKRVLSILRNSLETKQGYVEPPKQTKHIPDLIVIDDVDDSVIEITDLTKDNDIDSGKGVEKSTQNIGAPYLDQHIQMPKAVDSIYRDSDYQRYENVDLKNNSPENDVASRIRTKAELKVMPPSEESSVRSELKQDEIETKNDQVKLLPKSQKQHLFNQIREDLRLESVIKNEKSSDIPEVKVEPMNIEEIEKDAEVPIKIEHLENLEPKCFSEPLPEDLDWASACDNFMEQLKSGCHKKKTSRRHTNTLEFENDHKSEKNPKGECTDPSVERVLIDSSNSTHAVVIKQEPLEEEETRPEFLAILNITNEKENSDNIITENKTLTLEEKCVGDKDNTSVINEETVKEKKIENITELNNFNDNSINKQDNTILTEEVKKDQSESVESSIDKINIKENSDNKIDKGKYKEGEKSNKTKLKYKDISKGNKNKVHLKSKLKPEKNLPCSTTSIKNEIKDQEPFKTIIKEELESTDDDEPLIKSKLQKEKEQDDLFKYQLLKDLSEKTAYIKLECCDVDINKNSRKSIESPAKDKDEKQSRMKLTRQMSRSKGKVMSTESNKNDNTIGDTTSDSDDDELSVASRLRIRKNIKTEEGRILSNRTPIKSSPSKKTDGSSTSSSSTPIRKPGFGDGSDFHPGWEEELYRYKRSLRMPPRLIAIPRGRSGGPFVGKSGALFTRGSTSLPDLDPAPLSPAPSSAPSAATDDLYARRPDKLTLDSDLDSNSSCSAPHRLQYDSEASTSTIFSTSKTQKRSSIVDVLIQKCGKKDDGKKKRDREEKIPKIIPKSTNTSDLLPTPSLGLVKNGNKGSLSAKKEKLMEDIFYLGAFRKETVAAFRNAFIKDTDGLIGATEEFAPVVLKSRTRTESRVLKQRATIKEVFGDERPASAPPTSCRTEDPHEIDDNQVVHIKKGEPDNKPKLKSKKIMKDKLKRRSSSIRDGLRSTKSLKRNDAKGRLLRLKKRNSLMISLTNKKMKEIAGNKSKKENSQLQDDKDKSREESCSLNLPEVNTKRRLKRLFGRRKFSSGFDYIRKKKKIVRKDDTHKVRRPAVKPSPESIHDIQKEIKGWFINKSVGETHLHRAARLGYTDCVAYCLEKMEADPSAKDNAGFTPLHVASSKGHVRIARLLLQYGANVSAAAQGGIRPLHEACENCHVEVIRLLLSYGADPLLGTYAGQTPEDLTEGAATRLLRLHIADIQGLAVEPWRFPPPTEIIDVEELGCDPLSSPPPASPPPPPDSTIEIQTTDAPLPPFYSLRTTPGQPADGLWCLLQDITNLLQIKSKDSLLKQIHCGSGSPKELLREIRTQEFLERAQCHQLLGAGEKVNVRASKVALVRVTDKLRQLLKIETVLVS